MKTLPAKPHAAFTLIEIAIAIGVIGFALVAIIGILPTGLEVQRDNRTETILNQDGTFWLEAIRNGARTTNDLNLLAHVERIEVVGPGSSNSFSNFTRDEQILGLLTTQAALPTTNVTAYVWAVSGSAAEQEPAAANRDFAFRYRMTVDIQAATNFAASFTALSTNALSIEAEPMEPLYQVRLTFAYPLAPKNPPPRRQSYATLVSRPLTATNDGLYQLFFFTQ